MTLKGRNKRKQRLRSLGYCTTCLMCDVAGCIGWTWTSVQVSSGYQPVTSGHAISRTFSHKSFPSTAFHSLTYIPGAPGKGGVPQAAGRSEVQDFPPGPTLSHILERQEAEVSQSCRTCLLVLLAGQASTAFSAMRAMRLCAAGQRISGPAGARGGLAPAPRPWTASARPSQVRRPLVIRGSGREKHVGAGRSASPPA